MSTKGAVGSHSFDPRFHVDVRFSVTVAEDRDDPEGEARRLIKHYLRRIPLNTEADWGGKFAIVRDIEYDVKETLVG